MTDGPRIGEVLPVQNCHESRFRNEAVSQFLDFVRVIDRCDGFLSFPELTEFPDYFM